VPPEVTSEPPADVPVAATLTLGRAGLLALLARIEPPLGDARSLSGDARAVDRLHGWFDRVQGLRRA
jgi:hypothetical protein